MLEPDRDQIEQFVDALFRHCGKDGYVSIRSFFDDEISSKPFRIEAVPIKAGFKYLVDVAEDHARRAANEPKRIVFCPPIAVFNNKDHAAEKDLLAGLVLSIECDHEPDAARAKLERILGPATVVVRSGGQWQTPRGLPRDKLHIHFRLMQPASGDALAKLKRARRLAMRLANGDASNVPVVHPIRWPGSWHRKHEPVLCEIETLEPDREIDLDAALAALEAAVPGKDGNGFDHDYQGNDDGDRERPDWAALVQNILTGKELHHSTLRLAASYIGMGMKPEHALRQLQALMLASTMPHDERWQARFADLERLVRDGADKYGNNQQTCTQNEALESARASSFQMKAVQWVWPNRFAIGKLGVVAGLPDEGKGQILCYIAARITNKTDKQWPCSEGTAPAGNVILLTAEDDPSDTVVPRLTAAGADLDRVHIVKMVRNQKGGRRMFSLVTDLELLRRKVVEVGDVVAIEIDPISAYLGHKKMDSFRTTDVRAVLSPLVELAAELKLAIIAIMHFNKKVDITNALLRISDSLAFGAAARHVYGVIADAEHERKLFVRAKNNLSARAKDKALAYDFTACEVGKDPDTGEAIWAPYVIWQPDYIDVTATEAMQAATETRSPTARDEAKKFLAELLANGPVARNEIEDAAEGNGIAWRTVERAKSELKIMAKKDGQNGEWMWRLPSLSNRNWHDNDFDL